MSCGGLHKQLPLTTHAFSFLFDVPKLLVQIHPVLKFLGEQREQATLQP
jgi:hypothetical protein